MQELQSLRDEMRDIRRDVIISLINKGRRNGPFNCSRTTEFHQPPHFDEELHLLLTVVEEAVLEEEAYLDTLKKFYDHKLGMESHYMMVMNMFHLLPTLEETKKSQAPMDVKLGSLTRARARNSRFMAIREEHPTDDGSPAPTIIESHGIPAAATVMAFPVFDAFVQARYYPTCEPFQTF
ncbi:hypothetical protein M9H77_34401 [Catharanthus roseus]|uniref:Uncharacterized protein n=1 Tax=Catharanthus roseus TaxID=4058 RepID=A0ACB9ZL37_CATRO|nr:hypothetical protein M9H77_34401 [Catharanthus roseus]